MLLYMISLRKLFPITDDGKEKFIIKEAPQQRSAFWLRRRHSASGSRVGGFLHLTFELWRFNLKIPAGYRTVTFFKADELSARPNRTT